MSGGRWERWERGECLVRVPRLNSAPRVLKTPDVRMCLKLFASVWGRDPGPDRLQSAPVSSNNTVCLRLRGTVLCEEPEGFNYSFGCEYYRA